ncbi:4Fe-4S dicluster domain-containing protein [Anaerobacillus isosaccharinicus]|uniref:4Fe-4S dicluster domain-containing protein n=1 Tax=Anaerobacillus isosaccharinicus TaxID=1532552 RepID=A0A1S2LRN9_9BACI|nr:4Fe-4S dicluster domain-containing protein [Anaerobacillus isosaccharinicus]MBA5585436.1 4Fe-4S dicluster domain-containing protein [Anaerobacillus isosaccharinicus]QOY36246.1 4Fe-4S dicluster domain-containing protein [Anaerobacillus isosaccharinicus]
MWFSLLKKKIGVRNFQGVLFEEYCLNSNRTTPICTTCIELCQPGALFFDNGKLNLDYSKCENCKFCIYHCPTYAIHLETDVIYKYEEKIKRSEVVCFTCDQNIKFEGDITVPCLSILSPELLFVAFVHKKPVQIYLDKNTCKTCKNNWSMKKSISYLQELNYLSNCHVEIINGQYEKMKESPLKRRAIDLFDVITRRLKKQTNLTSCSYNENIGEILNRTYLLEYLKIDQKEQYLSKKLAKALKLVKIEVSDECILCGDCVENCPVGALSITSNTKKEILQFQMMKCIDCEICKNTCLYINRSTETKLNEDLLKRKTLHEKLI